MLRGARATERKPPDYGATATVLQRLRTAGSIDAFLQAPIEVARQPEKAWRVEALTRRDGDGHVFQQRFRQTRRSS
jgi:hypothetical protein